MNLYKKINIEDKKKINFKFNKLAKEIIIKSIRDKKPLIKTKPLIKLELNRLFNNEPAKIGIPNKIEQLSSEIAKIIYESINRKF